MSRGPIRSAAAAARRCAAAIAGCRAAPDAEAATWRDRLPLARPTRRRSAWRRRATRSAWRQRRHELRLREAAAPGSFLREMHAALDPKRMAAGQICSDGARRPRAAALRARVRLCRRARRRRRRRRLRPDRFAACTAALFGGPETISCPSCHWIGGPNGAGAETDNAFLAGRRRAHGSGDARNPPALVALGVVQALAREMTSRPAEAARRPRARSRARRRSREARLIAKGVDFGVLRATPKGELDASGIRGVDAGPGRQAVRLEGNARRASPTSPARRCRCTSASRATSCSRAARASWSATGKDRADPDGDGVRDELGRGPFAAMIAHLALLELPIVEPLIQDRPLEPAATGAARRRRRPASPTTSSAVASSSTSSAAPAATCR